MSALQRAFLLLYFMPSITCGEPPPLGHMQPLGSHREPELVPRPSPLPTSGEFYQEYVQPLRPVVLVGAVEGTEVAANWRKDEYLRTHFGSENVHVEKHKKESRSDLTFNISLEEFIQRYDTEDIYLVTPMPQSMFREWLLPKMLLCGGFTDNFVHTNLWFSSGGTKSVLHTDSYENLNCVVSGSKEFVLFEPHYSTVIGSEHASSGYYNIDVDKVDLIAYPGLVDLPWHRATLNAGDCLYIPFEWIHHVRSYDRNLAVNIWWLPFTFKEEDCLRDIPDFAPLGDFPLAPGIQVRAYLKKNQRSDGSIHVEDVYKDIIQPEYFPGVTVEQVEKLFDIVEPGCNGVLHSSRLDSVPMEHYRSALDYVISIQNMMINDHGTDNKDKADDVGRDDTEYMYFGDQDEQFGGTGYDDYELYNDAEHVEGGGDFMHQDHHFRDEL